MSLDSSHWDKLNNSYFIFLILIYAEMSLNVTLTLGHFISKFIDSINMKILLLDAF